MDDVRETTATENLVARVPVQVVRTELAAGAAMLASVVTLLAGWHLRPYRGSGLVAIRLWVTPGGGAEAARRAACVAYAVKAGVRLCGSDGVSVERMGVVANRAWIPVQGLTPEVLDSMLRSADWPAQVKPPADLPRRGSFKPRGVKGAR